MADTNNTESRKQMPQMDGYTSLKSDPAGILERELQDPHLQSLQQRLFAIESSKVIPPSQKEAMIKDLYSELMSAHFKKDNGNGSAPQPVVTKQASASTKSASSSHVAIPKFGAVTDTYSWDQDEFEVSIRIPVDGNTTGKHIDWMLKADKMRVAIKQTGQVFLDGDLFAKVNVDDCDWQLEKDGANGGKVILITLAKATKTFGAGHWNCVVKGGDVVDTSEWAEHHMKEFGDR